MLRLGYPLLSADDVIALKTLVREQHQRLGRPLRGVEIGPWLGRSTLSLLAADLPLGLPLPYEEPFYDFLTARVPDMAALERECEALLARLPAAMPADTLRHLLTVAYSWRVERKTRYFERLWCFDTWQGIASETALYFRETGQARPKQIFLDNIACAGFEAVVEAVERDATPLEQVVPAPVDFVFIDGDHEFASVVADLYAVRPLLGPHTLLCGHDIGNVERWPGVRLAVDQFVQDYHVRANVWVAHASGVAHLQRLPEYASVADLVEEVHRLQQQRYQDPQYCARFHLPPPATRHGEGAAAPEADARATASYRHAQDTRP